MDVTIMPSIDWLIQKLQADYPQFSFVSGNTHRWSPFEKTVYYPDLPIAHELLHETSHGLLGHSQFSLDIHLIEMERQAWQYARDTLAPRYGLKIEQAAIEAELDTYRDWLHARSLCPDCESNGLQDAASKAYRCLNCNSQWRASDGRRRGLKRYRLV